MKNILAIVLTIISCAGAAATESPEILKQSINFYNARKFQQSIEALEKIKSSSVNSNIWNYYYGLNLVRTDRSSEAVEYFEKIIESGNMDDFSKAYYQIGLIQFQRGEYSRAKTSFELAMDVSKDPKLDNKLEQMIEKSIIFGNFYSRSKRYNLAFLIGYTYDSNILNLAPDSFDINLAGHVFSYGAIGSVKVINEIDRILEPTVAVIDSYTLDSKFKTDATIQSADALQILFSLPYKANGNWFSLPTNYELSGNFLQVYLPTSTDTKRQLSLTTIYAKFAANFSVSNQYTSKYQLVASSDKSATAAASADNDSDGTNIDFSTTQYYSLSNQRDVNVLADLGYASNTTNGKNYTYNKTKLALGLELPTWRSTVSVFKLTYSLLEYPKMESSRRDHQSGFSVSTSKGITNNSSLGLSLAYVNNQSTADINKYSDVAGGLQYTHAFGF